MIFKTRNIFVFILIILANIVQAQNKDYQYALIEAVKQKNLGNLPGAIELYNIVLKANSSVGVAHYELGTLYALTGNGEKALMHLKKANEIDPENKWYFEAYIEVLLMEQEYDDAKNLLEEKISSDSEDVENQFKHANVLFLEGKPRKAIRALEDLEEQHGMSEKVTLLKANIYEQEKDFDKALEEIQKILELFPESIQIRIVAAELAMKSHQENLAATYYAEVLEQDSLNIFALTNLTDYYRSNKNFDKSFYYLNRSFQSKEIDYDKKMAILGFYLSDEFFFRNYQDELEILLVTMMNLYPGKRDPHLFAADFYIQKRDFHKALDALIPIFDQEEKEYRVWRQGILLSNATNNNKSMLAIASKAVHMFPDSAEMYYYKGIAEFDEKEYEAVLETFSQERISRLNDPMLTSQARMLVAESYNNLSMYNKADSLFRIILQEEPDNYLVMNNFSYYLSLRKESLDEAEEMSKKVIEQFPENSTYLDTYAWILYQLEEYSEAEKYIMKALKYGGQNDPDVMEHAGDILRMREKIELAREKYRTAIILGGDKDTLEEKIKNLDGQ